MECYSCKGKLHKGKTSYTITRKGYHLIVDHVPAWVCEQCGEVLLEEAQVKAIQQLIEKTDVSVSALVSVPV
ncbi:MAG: YgiT-type zinc finger protein [Anaerolineae bacterium]|nr:YgiT-type zinc finger protein [Anaerolineae bacterium]